MRAERYQAGDYVQDRAGNHGVVRRCTSKRTRETFLRVYIYDGPRKGQWDAPHRFQVALDYPGGTVEDACPDCFRGFKRRADEDPVFCRECARQKRIKTLVRQFHRYRCLVCRRSTMVVHEHLPRSLRGPVSLENSFLACDHHDGGVCHPLLQQRKIHAFNTKAGSDQDPRGFDARQPITFEVPRRYLDDVFADGRPIPDVVRIVE